MFIVEDAQIINPLNHTANHPAASNRWKNDVISKDIEVISRQFHDIYRHFYLPVSRQKDYLNRTWIKQAQSLFPYMRSLSAEKRDIHLNGIKRVFKPTGRNLHNYD